MGILSGMALGGGTLLVPVLVYFFGISQHVAQGVSLTSFIPTAIIAVITHSYQKNVNFPLAIKLIIGSIIGAVGGSFLANNFLEAEVLKKFFGIFLIFMGIYQYFGQVKQRREKL